MIFVADLWFRYSFQNNFTLLFLYLSSVKGFYTKIYVVLYLLFSFFSLMRLHDVSYVCLRTCRKQKKKTLWYQPSLIISKRYKYLSVHAPVKGGRDLKLSYAAV